MWSSLVSVLFAVLLPLHLVTFYMCHATSFFHIHKYVTDLAYFDHVIAFEALYLQAGLYSVAAVNIFAAAHYIWALPLMETAPWQQCHDQNMWWNNIRLLYETVTYWCWYTPIPTHTSTQLLFPAQRVAKWMWVQSLENRTSVSKSKSCLNDGSKKDLTTSDERYNTWLAQFHPDYGTLYGLEVVWLV